MKLGVILSGGRFGGPNVGWALGCKPSRMDITSDELVEMSRPSPLKGGGNPIFFISTPHSSSYLMGLTADVGILR